MGDKRRGRTADTSRAIGGLPERGRRGGGGGRFGGAARERGARDTPKSGRRGGGGGRAGPQDTGEVREGSLFPSYPPFWCVGRVFFSQYPHWGGGHSRFGGFSSFTPYLASPPTPQEELEHLNQANEEINRVELQLDVSLSPVPYWSPSPRSLVLNWFPSPFSSLPNWFPTCPPQSLTGPPQSLSPGS